MSIIQLFIIELTEFKFQSNNPPNIYILSWFVTNDIISLRFSKLSSFGLAYWRIEEEEIIFCSTYTSNAPIIVLVANKRNKILGLRL